MTSSKQDQLDQDKRSVLMREVERLSRENAELLKLKQDNVRLEERNLRLSAELSARTRELEIALDASKDSKAHHTINTINTSPLLSVDEDLRGDNYSNLPGDSYPAVAASLDEVESDVNTDNELETVDAHKKSEPDYLLQKLQKGGNRMDQIKRQLVVQRGAIVAALKVLAQSRTSGSGMSSFKSSSGSLVSEEKDRVLVSITAESDNTSCKMCPMCEAMFPMNNEDEFEQHVMDHFSYDSDQDTLQYYDAQPPEEHDIQTDHL